MRESHSSNHPMGRRAAIEQRHLPITATAQGLLQRTVRSTFALRTCSSHLNGGADVRMGPSGGNFDAELCVIRSEAHPDR